MPKHVPHRHKPEPHAKAQHQRRPVIIERKDQDEPLGVDHDPPGDALISQNEEELRDVRGPKQRNEGE